MRAIRNSTLFPVLCFFYGRILIPTEHLQALETSVAPSHSLSLIPSGQSAIKSTEGTGHDATIGADQIDKFRAQTEDWQELQNSFQFLEKEVKSCESQNPMSNEIKKAKKALDKLKFFQKHIFTCFGELNKKQIHDKPRSIQLKSTEGAENLRKRVMNLLILVSTTERGSPNYDHIITYQNRCIFQTIDYMKNYDLMPANIVKDVDSVMKSPKFFQWIVEELFQACTSENKFSYEVKEVFTTREIFDNNFLLPHLGKFYKGLSNDEKDLVWIYLLKYNLVSPEPQIRGSPLETITYKPSDLGIRCLLTFFDDTESFLINQIKGKKNDGDKKRFFLTLKSIISYLFSLIIEPAEENVGFDEQFECDTISSISSVHWFLFFNKFFGEDLMNEILNEGFIGEEIELKIIPNFVDTFTRHLSWNFTLLSYRKFFFQTSQSGNFHNIERVFKINQQIYYQKALKALSDCQKFSLQVQNNQRILQKLENSGYEESCSIASLEEARKELNEIYKLSTSLD